MHLFTQMWKDRSFSIAKVSLSLSLSLSLPCRMSWDIAVITRVSGLALVYVAHRNWKMWMVHLEAKLGIFY